MSEARRLLEAYVRQRMEMGEQRVVLAGAVGAARSRWADEDVSRAARPARPVPAAEHVGSPAAGAQWRKNLPPIPPRGIVVEAPSKDLFTSDPLANTTLDQLAQLIGSCTKCALAGHRTHTVPGEGPASARLVVVGEGPGAVEDETGRPFVGRAGELLTEILAAIELPREQVFICNVVKCRPPDNRKPLPEEIAACVPYLHRQIETIRPRVILAMGATAAETLLGVRQSLGQLRNQVHEYRGIPLVVTYHPAALLRNPHWKKPTWDDVRIARQLLDQQS